MRRLWAFLTMLISLVIGLGFIAQPIVDETNVSGEFSNGMSVVYQISREANGDSLDSIDVAGALNDRLDTAGVRGAKVEIMSADSGYDGNSDSDFTSGETEMVRISFSDKSDLELSDLRRVLEGNGELAITTADNYVLEGDDFFADTPATLEYDDSGNPFVAIHPTDTDAWTEVSDHLSTLTDDTEKTRVLIWRGYDKDNDTYDKVYNDDYDDIDQLVKDKVVVVLDTSSAYDSTENYLKVTSDTSWDVFTSRVPWSIDGESTDFTISSARALVNSLNASDYGFDITFQYTATTSATLGTDAIYWAIGGFLGAYLLAFVALIVLYGLAGLISFVTNASGLMLSIYLSSFVGFEFSIAYLLGLGLVAILGILVTVNYFERVKNELRKGRSIDKANKEGYRKSFKLTLDLTASAFFVSLFSFLVARGMTKVGFGVIVVGSIFVFLVVNYLTKWLMYWLTSYAKTGSPKLVFGFRLDRERPLYDAQAELSKEVLPDRALAHDKAIKSKSRNWGILAAAVSLIFLGGITYYGITGGVDSFFNASGDYASNYRVDMMTTATGYLSADGKDVDFNSAADIVSYLEEKVLDQAAQEYTDINGNSNPLSLAEYEEKVGLDFSDSSFYITEVETNTAETDDPTFDVIYVSFSMPVLSDDSVNEQRIEAFDLIGDAMNDLITENGYSAALENISVADSAKPDELQDRYTPYVRVGEAVSGNISHDNEWLSIVLTLLVVFAAVYAGIRYGLSAGLVSFFSGFVAVLAGLAFLVISRVPFTSITGYGLIGAGLFATVLPLLSFARNRELLKDGRVIRTASKELRLEYFLKATGISLPIFAVAGGCLILVSILGSSLFGGSVYGLGLTLFVGGLVGWSFTVFGLPYMYVSLRSAMKFQWYKDKVSKYRAKHPKRPGKRQITADPNEARETVVPGINDYRNF